MRTKLWFWMLLLSGCTLVGRNAFAQFPDGPPREGNAGGGPARPGGPGGPGGRQAPPRPLQRALDANHDGTLSAEEIAAAPHSLLTLDRDGDGTLSPDELAGPGETTAPSPNQLVLQLMSFDRNGDGVLTKDECPSGCRICLPAPTPITTANSRAKNCAHSPCARPTPAAPRAANLTEIL